MAEHSNDAPHRVHNPFDAPAPKNSGGFWIGLAFALTLNAGLVFWVAQSKFQIKEKLFEDEKLDTQLIKPPPPPPPPPPSEKPPPPAKLQPRPPALIPPDVAPPPPLQVPPVEKKDRVETTAPPVIAPTAPPPQRPSIISNPDWSRRPDADAMARFYPDRAQRLEKEGRVTIVCKVKANGTLEACDVVSEDPPDMGFGDATLKASRLFKMKPQTRDGAPVDGAGVRVTLVWKLPQ